jgi:hypothetical protein
MPHSTYYIFLKKKILSSKELNDVEEGHIGTNKTRIYGEVYVFSSFRSIIFNLMHLKSKLCEIMLLANNSALSFSVIIALYKPLLFTLLHLTQILSGNQGMMVER